MFLTPLTRTVTLGVFTLGLLSACPPLSSPGIPSGTPSNSPSASPEASPSASTAPATEPTQAASTASPAPEVTASPLPGSSGSPVAVSSGKPGQDLSQVKSLSLIASQRFLNASGETLQLTPVLKDAQGNTLTAADFPLEWRSSRPLDFGVNAEGKVTALVGSGYSNISLTLTGTTMSVVQLVSVASGEGGGSGGGQAKEPTEENVNGEIKFQF